MEKAHREEPQENLNSKDGKRQRRKIKLIKKKEKPKELGVMSCQFYFNYQQIQLTYLPSKQTPHFWCAQ